MRQRPENLSLKVSFSNVIFLALINEHTRHALNPRKSLGIVSIDIFVRHYTAVCTVHTNITPLLNSDILHSKDYTNISYEPWITDQLRLHAAVHTT